ncbi:murein hydrolase activator EnvC family protein [Sphingomonas flavescens]|uniref:murein hydrolase activator EnvC family protein n=1 Tax=Sphingomonas flavescens TaxID=3132797 RepID=UPI0028048D3D|nr:peptidoglycan DD-metalloendopeptidase family protein [Sphingomonas limnosediminicola]
MKRAFLALLLCPFVAASALAQDLSQPLDATLKAAELEQRTAEADADKLEQAASKAKTDVARLHAEQAAAAQAIAAAEARITAANARLQLASAMVAAYRQRLSAEQQPVASLLAGLANMARRPPLLFLADQGGTDELVRVRLLLDATLPVIRQRTARLSGEVAEGERMRQSALAAREELARSRGELIARHRRYAALERRSIQVALATSGQALTAGDSAMAATETVEKLRGEQASSQSIRAVAGRLASEPPAPPSPFAPEGSLQRLPFVYQLPASAPVTEGLAAVNENGVRSRGLTLATLRGAPVAAPAAGTVRFAGPFRDYDGVLIIDHGAGWLSLIVNVGSTLRAGDRVTLGQPVGRALGPLQVELSQNGRRMSPAIIAGSSQSLSKTVKGG